MNYRQFLLAARSVETWGKRPIGSVQLVYDWYDGPKSGALWLTNDLGAAWFQQIGALESDSGEHRWYEIFRLDDGVLRDFCRLDVDGLLIKRRSWMPATGFELMWERLLATKGTRVATVRVESLIDQPPISIELVPALEA